YVLFGPARPTDHDGRVARVLAVRGVALPHRFARPLVQGHDGGIRSARGANDLVAVHQRGLRESPRTTRPFEILSKAHPPALAAIGKGDTDHIPELTYCVHEVPIHGRRATRAGVSAAPLGLADLGVPELAPILAAHGNDVTRTAHVSHGEDLIPD